MRDKKASVEDLDNDEEEEDQQAVPPKLLKGD
jgi:hypothetical protein